MGSSSMTGVVLSMIAVLAMLLLFGMDLNRYLMVLNSTTAVVDDRSIDREFLRIDFNISFPSLSCEYATVDVNDLLGTNRLSITKTIQKFAIDQELRPTGLHFTKHTEESGEGSIILNESNFESFVNRYSIVVVKFYAPWCYWSKRLKPSWDKAAGIMSERYDPRVDGRIHLAEVDCTAETDLCRRHHIQGYPSMRIFRNGSDIIHNEHGHHDHESYFGDRDTESLVRMMTELVESIPRKFTGGCRIEGYVHVEKVPGYFIFSTHSEAHSLDTAKQIMNMTHVIHHLSFGKSSNIIIREPHYVVFNSGF